MDWTELFRQLYRVFPRVEVINQDEGGLFLRCGKLKKTIGAGVYFCLPIVDEIVRFTSATTTLGSSTQSVTTRDKRDLLVSWSATYLIQYPKIAFLETDDIQAQIHSSLSQRLLDYINQNEYQYLRSSKIVAYMVSEGFRDDFREEWGINLVGFYLKDLTLHRTFRIVNNAETTEVETY